ncbi:MAG TPA: VTT domain-containing protein [Paenibacillus sp.]|nr:VTT domain-containing protein [Paenibacillus sp.]
MVQWLETFGAWGLAIHSFADAIFFPIPAFFLQVSLSAVDPASALWLATAGYVACLLGTPVGYALGRSVGTPLLNKLLKRSWVDAATALFRKNGQAAILIGAFTPIPFKVFTILSGSFHYPLWQLIAYASLGRAVKFYVVGGLFYWYGQTAEGMVKEVSGYVAVAAALLIACFLWIRRRYVRNKRLRAEAAAAAEASEPIDSMRGEGGKRHEGDAS